MNLGCIVGIGNPFLTDDAGGVHTVRKTGVLIDNHDINADVLECHAWNLEHLFDV